MASGRKVLRQNTRERIISTDFNRLQSFVAAYANEALREQMLVPQDDSLAVGTTFPTAGALTTAVDITVPYAPLYGGVLNGLMVVVPIGVQYLLITSGMLLMIDPDGQAGSSNPNPATPDDLGPAKLVYSAGVQTAGSLAWTPNPGPGIRIDVVECQRTDLVAETDNRDIFNPSTGLFTPVAVTKVTVGDLTYRVRPGVPGGGLPAPALGWFPLAIISAPAGAATLDACTVWDVRNLLSDLATPYANVRNLIPRVDRYKMFLDRFTSPPQYRLSGQALGTYNGWKIGGLFAQSFAQPWTDIADANYAQAAGLVLQPSLPIYVYALWPSGYVRWVKYYSTAIAGIGGRCPGPFRGVLTVSHVPPLNGQPIAPVPLPSGWGLNTSTVLGMSLAAGVTDGASIPQGFIADRSMTYLETLSTWSSVAPSSLVDPVVDFTLTPGLDFPFGTSRIRLALTAFLGGTAAGNSYFITSDFQVMEAAGPNQVAAIAFRYTGLTNPGFLFLPYTEIVEVPVGADGLSAPPPLLFRWTLSRNPIGGAPPSAIAAAFAMVMGWDA